MSRGLRPPSVQALEQGHAGAILGDGVMPVTDFLVPSAHEEPGGVFRRSPLDPKFHSRPAPAGPFFGGLTG
jgi:hypothetical protein